MLLCGEADCNPATSYKCALPTNVDDDSSGYKISLLINKFAQSPSTRCISQFRVAQTSCPALFLPGKYNDKTANSADVCLEAPIPLTFKDMNIVLMF